MRKPACTDCHQGHDALTPGSAEFRFGLLNRCGNCHPDLSQRYRVSLHGQLTELGYLPAATCSDCHGPHDILPVTDSQSHVAGTNRVETCRKCHPNANANFAQFDPHADDHDRVNYPLLYHVRTKTGSLLGIGVGLFLVHGVFWFTRAFAHTRRFGSDRMLIADAPAVIRLVPTQRTAYFLLLASFLGLAWTGLPLKFSHFAWAQRVAGGLGGFGVVSVWHHFFGVVLICAALISVVNGFRRWYAAPPGARPALFGPDSPLPNRRDVRDVRENVALVHRTWQAPAVRELDVLGEARLLGRLLGHPDRGDLGADAVATELVYAVPARIGVESGQDNPCGIGVDDWRVHPADSHLQYSPAAGQISDGCHAVHRIDQSVHLRAARPEYLERMLHEGRLDEVVTVTPGKERLRPAIWSGGVLLVIGCVLLVAILLAVLSK